MENTELVIKYQNLLENLRSLGNAAVAFSGGVDSAFLLNAAKEALGDAVLAITASAAFFPKRELKEAKEFCERKGIRQIFSETDWKEIDGFEKNPKNRCYLCKTELFGRIQKLAESNGIRSVVEGSNLDDEGDYRPGMQAIAELGILSPLRKAKLTKAEIRQLSKTLGLPTWEKPSFACLASRFVYGEVITEEKLHRIDLAEQYLMHLGFTQMRVRIHGEMARIELLPSDIPRMLEEERRVQIYEYLKALGFSYVTMDLKGYRTGSMNETL